MLDVIGDGLRVGLGISVGNICGGLRYGVRGKSGGSSRGNIHGVTLDSGASWDEPFLILGQLQQV